MAVRFTCPLGHEWEASESPAGGPPPCPVCAGLRDTPPPPTLPPDSWTTAGPLPPAHGLHTVSVPGYEILSELGRGGMGVVYKARDRTLARLVALKMILSGPFAAPEELARFQREARLLAQLQHPNIVQIHSFGEQAGFPYLVLEFVDGGSLAGKLESGCLPVRESAELLGLLARVLHHAHQHGIV